MMEKGRLLLRWFEQGHGEIRGLELEHHPRKPSARADIQNSKARSRPNERLVWLEQLEGGQRIEKMLADDIAFGGQARQIDLCIPP